MRPPSPVETLLLAAKLGRSLYATWRLRRIMKSVATVAILAVATVLLLSILIVVGLYAAYVALLAAGFTQLQGLGMIGGVILLIILLLTRAIKRSMRSFKTPASKVNGVVDSFIDGLLGQ